MENQKKRFHLDFQELYFESTADFNRYCAGDERVPPHFGMYRGTEAILHGIMQKEVPVIKDAIQMITEELPLPLSEDLEFKLLGFTISRIKAGTHVNVELSTSELKTVESDETKLENCFVFLHQGIARWNKKDKYNHLLGKLYAIRKLMNNVREYEEEDMEEILFFLADEERKIEMKIEKKYKTDFPYILMDFYKGGKPSLTRFETLGEAIEARSLLGLEATKILWDYINDRREIGKLGQEVPEDFIEPSKVI